MDGFKGTVTYDASLDKAQYIVPQVPSTVYFCFVPECSNDAQCIETLYLRRHHVTCEASMRLLLKEWIPQLRSRASDPWFTTVSPALHHQPPPPIVLPQLSPSHAPLLEHHIEVVSENRCLLR